MKYPNTLISWFCLTVSFGLLACPSSFAAKTPDPITEVEAYLDQIRTKIDAIQQSVDEVEEPPLAERVVEAFSWKACYSVGTLLQLGMGGEFEVQLKGEAKAEPGAAIFSGVVRALIGPKGSLSADLNTLAGLNASVCMDLWKLCKVIAEEIPQEEGLRLLASGEPVELGLLGDISLEAREYLLALAYANPAALYNELLDSEVNEAFGFNPGAIIGVAEGLGEVMLDSQYVSDPNTVFTDVVDRLGALVAVLPFAGEINLDVNSIFSHSEAFNPCSYKDLIPFGPMELCEDSEGIESELAGVVGLVDNLLKLADIETAVNAAKTALDYVKETTLSLIDDLIGEEGLKDAKDDICTLISVFSC